MIAGVLKVVTQGKGSETNLLLKNHIEKMSLSKNQLEIKFIYQNDQWGNQPTPNPTNIKENKQGAGAGKSKTKTPLKDSENNHFNHTLSQNKDVSEENRANTHEKQDVANGDLAGSPAGGQDHTSDSQENFTRKASTSDLAQEPTAYDLSGAGSDGTKNRRHKKKGGQARTSSNTAENLVRNFNASERRAFL